MYKLFCCRSRRTSRVQVDEITDSLEKCLSVEQGIVEFRTFLERKRLLDELGTLNFALECQRIIVEISRMSQRTRKMGLPEIIQRDITVLHRTEINFDLAQMQTLDNLNSDNIEVIVQTLETARNWAIDLLRGVYRTFKNDILEKSGSLNVR